MIHQSVTILLDEEILDELDRRARARFSRAQTADGVEESGDLSGRVLEAVRGEVVTELLRARPPAR